MAEKKNEVGGEVLQVFVRVRPPISKEVKFENAVTVSGQNIALRSEKYNVSCKYNRVFDEIDDQETVFANIQPLLSTVLNGYNACIFAYGQTSAGKSHTMLGPNGGTHAAFDMSKDQWGVIPRAAEYLFGEMYKAADEGNLSYKVKASFVQIYNENLYDLLKESSTQNADNKGSSSFAKTGDRNQLKIRETPKPRRKGSLGDQHEVYISGLSEFRVQTEEDVMQLVEVGTKNRTTRSTDYNETSSRSHAILQLTFEIEKFSPSGQRILIRSKLSLVDLAGSEKMQLSTDVSSESKHLRELTSINQSLSSLGNVIAALSTNKGHIPYRDSKLTRLLQDSLGGNTRTIILACIAPTVQHAHETVNTLQFADRAKSVMLKVRANTVVDDKDLLAKANAEIHRLKILLQHALKDNEMRRSNNVIHNSDDNDNENSNSYNNDYNNSSSNNNNNNDNNDDITQRLILENQKLKIDNINIKSAFEKYMKHQKSEDYGQNDKIQESTSNSMNTNNDPNFNRKSKDFNHESNFDYSRSSDGSMKSKGNGSNKAFSVSADSSTINLNNYNGSNSRYNDGDKDQEKKVLEKAYDNIGTGRYPSHDDTGSDKYSNVGNTGSSPINKGVSYHASPGQVLGNYKPPPDMRVRGSSGVGSKDKSLKSDNVPLDNMSKKKEKKMNLSNPPEYKFNGESSLNSYNGPEMMLLSSSMEKTNNAIRIAEEKKKKNGNKVPKRESEQQRHISQQGYQGGGGQQSSSGKYKLEMEIKNDERRRAFQESSLEERLEKESENDTAEKFRRDISYTSAALRVPSPKSQLLLENQLEINSLINQYKRKESSKSNQIKAYNSITEDEESHHTSELDSDTGTIAQAIKEAGVRIRPLQKSFSIHDPPPTLPQIIPPSLAYSKDDTGMMIQMFSFRFNAWDIITLTNYEPQRGFHQCRSVTVRLLLLDSLIFFFLFYIQISSYITYFFV
jgi:kinesin family protein 3/17